MLSNKLLCVCDAKNDDSKNIGIHMKQLMFLIILIFTVSNCLAKPNNKEIEKQVLQSLSNELFLVENYKKTNGFEKNSKTYTAYVNYDIVFKKSLQDFAEQSPLEAMALQMQFGDFKPGFRVMKEERVMFIKTENGWRIDGKTNERIISTSVPSKPIKKKNAYSLAKWIVPPTKVTSSSVSNGKIKLKNKAKQKKVAMPQWKSSVIKHIKKRWSYPADSSGSKGQVEFIVSGSGFISGGVKLSSCSGTIPFCNSIKNAVNNSEPFPMPPSRGQLNQLELEFSVEK